MRLPFVVALATIGSLLTIPGLDAAETPAVEALLAQARRNVEQTRKGEIHLRVVDAAGQPVAGATVTLDQRSHHFRFGSIAFELIPPGHFTPEQEALFKARFTQLFNLAVLPFYWDGYEHVPGQTGWERAAAVAQWCRENGITAKGHPLAWTHVAGTPAWLHDLPAEYSRTLLQARIVGAVKGFSGAINLWDVCNETANTVPWDTAMRMPGQNEGARYDNQGPTLAEIADWVEPCYRWSHAANPQATLVLNDFGQIAWPPVRERFFALVKELQRRGTPLHGIGLQAHEPRTEWFHPQKFWDTLERYRELNLPIHITEFHPHSLGAPISGGYREGTWSEESQAEFARMMYTLAFGHPSVVSFTWWDFTENDSYIKGSALLNKDLSPKPAYRVLDQLINHDWKTHVQLRTDADGQAVARGFFGDYEVRVGSGSAPPATFQHTPDRPSDWTVRVGRPPAAGSPADARS
jgi:GH35 family endo-1,4-beta-xylanase